MLGFKGMQQRPVNTVVNETKMWAFCKGLVVPCIRKYKSDYLCSLTWSCTCTFHSKFHTILACKYIAISSSLSGINMGITLHGLQWFMKVVQYQLIDGIKDWSMNVLFTSDAHIL